MTSEEIKEQYKMPDILSMYGLQPNRAGKIRCPFHSGDQNASCKIYDDSFYCFGCGASGDIFKFVELMDGCSFKEAFVKLGGDYPHEDPRESSGFKQRYARYKFQKQKELRKKQQEKERYKIECNNEMIDFFRETAAMFPPLSEVRSMAIKGLEKEMYRHSQLHGIPFDDWEVMNVDRFRNQKPDG